MIFISLNADRAKIVEADMIEESQEHLEKRLNNYFKTTATSGYEKAIVRTLKFWTLAEIFL